MITSSTWYNPNGINFLLQRWVITVVLINFLLYSGARAGADSPAPLAPRRWRRLPTGAGNFTPLAAELSCCPPELFFTAGTTLIAARALVYGNPTRAPVKSSSVMPQVCVNELDKQRVLMHGHQGWNVRHGLCHIYVINVYIWVVYSFCLFCCLFIIVTTQFVALYKPCKPKPKPSTYDPPGQLPPGRDPNSDT